MKFLLSFWILPILFILHDFEEMIVMPIWKQRHASFMASLKKPFFGGVTNGQAFSVGVLEEMLMLIMASVVSFLFDNQIIYLVFMIMYTLHFQMHVSMCLKFKGYVPGIASALLELPVMVWLIVTFWIPSGVTILVFVLYFIPIFIIVFGNMWLLHREMPNVQNAMMRYTHSES